MGEVSKYPNGTFNWIDLGTIDVTSAKAFYEGLFGWEVEDLSAGDAGSYTMCRLQGKDVAGIHAHSADEGTDWSCYISVDDVDKSTMRAGELGGTVELEPVEIPGAARLSLIRDPSGASVPLWQAKGHTGAGRGWSTKWDRGAGASWSPPRPKRPRPSTASCLGGAPRWRRAPSPARRSP